VPRVLINGGISHSYKNVSWTMFGPGINSVLADGFVSGLIPIYATRVCVCLFLSLPSVIQGESVRH
jgi:hypothetical protein